MIPLPVRPAIAQTRKVETLCLSLTSMKRLREKGRAREAIVNFDFSSAVAIAGADFISPALQSSGRS